MNGAIFYDGTNLISTATPGVGDCLVAIAGVPTFTTCPGSGTKVNQITGTGGGSVAATGNVSINNSTTTTSAITIDDATTTTKGIASFNSGNFTVSSGAVSIANDSIALGTNTTGNYVASLATGNGLSGGGAGEGTTPTLNLVLQSSMGLQNTASGLGLITCSTPNDILKSNGTTWSCQADAAGVGGATTALDNLTTTSINQTLLADTTNTRDLGSSLVKWRDLYLQGNASVGGNLSGVDLTTSGDVAINGGDLPLQLPRLIY